MSLVVTCPSCRQPTPVDLSRTHGGRADQPAISPADDRVPRCIKCGADVSGALGPADADTALDSYAPHGTAVMKRPDVEAILAGHASQDIVDVNPGFEPLAPRRNVSSPMALASTVAGTGPSPLESTLQSRHDSVAYAEQLRARLPNVDVVSMQQQGEQVGAGGNAKARGGGAALGGVGSGAATTASPTQAERSEVSATAATGAAAAPPQAAEPAFQNFAPPPVFQAPMPPLGSSPQRGGLHWAIWVVLLVVVLGTLAAVVGFVLLAAV